MHYNVKIDTFEGPLDLLLHLINSLEIDIYDIPMAQITEQYLLYIHTMKELKLDLASEYLVMAATLLAIKSKMLLPKQEEELFDDIENSYEEDPRNELVERLIEYKKYKEAAVDLKEMEEERSLIFTKAPSDLSEYAKDILNSRPVAQTASIYDMLGALQKLMRRKRLQKPMATKIARQEISIETRMDEILGLISGKDGPFDFYDLFPYPEKEYIVITFLAILELMKRDEIIAEQTENFGEILIIPAGRGAAAVGYY